MCQEQFDLQELLEQTKTLLKSAVLNWIFQEQFSIPIVLI